MSPIDALTTSIATMQVVIDVAPIRPDQLTAPTPCTDFDVGRLTGHIIENHELFLTGAGGADGEVGSAATLGERHEAVAAAGIAQWTRRGTDGTVDLGGNAVPAEFAISLHALETYIHGWDLARSLDRPFQPGAELTTQMWEFANAFISDDLRGDQPGAPYGPTVPVDSAAATLDRLIAFSGRDPNKSLR